MKTNKNCQSCGMPLKKDPNSGGTEKDNKTISKLYCSYCYEEGEFINPNMTAVEMQALVKNKLKEMGFPGFLAGMFAKKTPKLKRWQ